MSGLRNLSEDFKPPFIYNAGIYLSFYNRPTFRVDDMITTVY